MINRDELIIEIHSIIGEDLLEKAKVKDELANGVQILGKEKVEKIALGVSLNEEFLQKAVDWGADLCIFHHGFDVRTYKSKFPLYSQNRLRLIFKHDLTILGYHFALDAHPTLGNNAQIISKLDAKIAEPLYEEWGYTATFDKPQDLQDLARRCQKIFDHDIFVVDSGNAKIRKIGVVSGGAKPYEKDVDEMIEKKIDLFISGETSESSPHKMQEVGISYFVCGHYATEVFGVKALGEKLQSKFKSKLEIEFVDVRNTI